MIVDFFILFLSLTQIILGLKIQPELSNVTKVS